MTSSKRYQDGDSISCCELFTAASGLCPDFLSLLPLTVILRDDGHAEKVISALSRRLSETGAPERAGEIAYYASNIAFYRGQGPDAQGVIRIGKILSGLEALEQPGQIGTTFSRIECV